MQEGGNIAYQCIYTYLFTPYTYSWEKGKVEISNMTREKKFGMGRSGGMGGGVQIYERGGEGRNTGNIANLGLSNIHMYIYR